MTTIVDIDDTIIRNRTQPIKRVIDYVNSLPGSITIVTGRPESQRAETVRALAAAGVKYSRLIMNPYSTRESNKHKAEVADKLKSTATLAIDDNPGARAAYSKAGIPTKDPATLPEMKKFWSIFSK
jgi:hypothetical protein